MEKCKRLHKCYYSYLLKAHLDFRTFVLLGTETGKKDIFPEPC